MCHPSHRSASSFCDFSALFLHSGIDPLLADGLLRLGTVRFSLQIRFLPFRAYPYTVPHHGLSLCFRKNPLPSFTQNGFVGVSLSISESITFCSITSIREVVSIFRMTTVTLPCRPYPPAHHAIRGESCPRFDADSKCPL